MKETTSNEQWRRWEWFGFFGVHWWETNIKNSYIEKTCDWQNTRGCETV